MADFCRVKAEATYRPTQYHLSAIYGTDLAPKSREHMAILSDWGKIVRGRRFKGPSNMSSADEVPVPKRDNMQ